MLYDFIVGSRWSEIAMAFISGFFNISSSEVVEVWRTPRQGESVIGLLGFIVVIAFIGSITDGIEQRA